MSISRLISCVLLMSVIAPTSYAATDVFLIQTNVGDDLVAPTIPADVAAVPVAIDQIDISWSAATDAFGVVGYQVFRDAVQIATTSLTSFSDTGLPASTLFSYAVTAFDAANNISGLSSSSATSTLTPVATSTPPASTGGNSSGIRRITDTESNLNQLDFSVDTSERQAIITYSTSQPARSELEWGRTASYEIGFSATEGLRSNHRHVITDLESGTVYEARVTLTSAAGERIARSFAFTTDAGPDMTAPPNAMNFAAFAADLGVVLTWNNPPAEDFTMVRILSSDIFYPTDEADGYLVYEGSAESVTDVRPIVGGVRYYTAFTYDAAGNISSGAVTSLIISDEAAEPTISTSTTVADFDKTELLEIADVFFSQPGDEIQSLDQRTVITTNEPTKISIPYESLPEHLKTILVSLRHPVNQNTTFSFLLKVNADRSAFEAVIGSLGEPGTYETTVEVFDFKTQRVSRVTGELIVVPGREAVVASTVSWWRWFLAIGLLLLLLLVLYREHRSWRKKYHQYS